MSTFFMEGCLNNSNEAVKYFDSIYLPVQEIIELDNQFQDQVHGQLVVKNEINGAFDLIQNEEEYAESIKSINESYQRLLKYTNSQLRTIQNVDIFNNEASFKKEAVSLVISYLEVVESDFAEMLLIFKKEDVSDDDNDRFNQLLNQSSRRLDKALKKFYKEASIYGDQHDIEFE
ncbi:MAG: hypothetical protein KAG64_01775 [Bacteroidales bacterium]|nr:hypothetical protein [Bacteroidales bacterium]